MAKEVADVAREEDPNISELFLARRIIAPLLFRSFDVTSYSVAYLRKILIHGARAVVLRIKRDRAPIGAWLDALDARAPKNVVVVVMANKLARIAWAVLSSGNEYRPIANAMAA
jgi:hypothetical protein